MKKAIGKEFDKEQVPRLLKVFHVESRFELEAKLQEVNSSLEIQKSDFIEIVLAREWYHQQVKVDEDFVRDELLSYYRDHGPEFDRPGQVRWEQLSVCVAKYPSRDAARAVLAQMGNDVIRGVPFAEVAKARSDGPTAANGGTWPWTAEGSLVSQQIERAIFGLPVASLAGSSRSRRRCASSALSNGREGTHIPFEEARRRFAKKILKNREKGRGTPSSIRSARESTSGRFTTTRPKPSVRRAACRCGKKCNGVWSKNSADTGDKPHYCDRNGVAYSVSGRY